MAICGGRRTRPCTRCWVQGQFNEMTLTAIHEEFLIRRSQSRIHFLHEWYELVEVL